MISNNAIACRKYYERNRDNPEFRLRKAYQTRKQYYKKRYTRFWKMFQAWKNLFIKPVVKVITKAKPAYTKLLETFKRKRSNALLKIMVDRWKEYERSPKPNHSCKPIVCCF